MRRVLLATLPLALGGLAACTDSPQPPSGAPGPAAPTRGFPALHVSTVVAGLDHPWDVKPLGHGRLPVPGCGRAALSLVQTGVRPTRACPSAKVWVSGETGLLGLAAAPAFARNHRIYTCQGSTLAD